MRLLVIKKPKKTRVWSIGICVGSSPVDWAPLEQPSNPVLTKEHISDVQAEFVADPFMVHSSSRWYMFFEVMNRDTGKGQIGLASSPDTRNWTYHQSVLVEPFHLSYPYVFEWDGDYFMIPETHTTDSIRLYRAERFPDRWSFVRTLMTGMPFTDSSILRHESRWWMFTETRPGRNDTLRLFYSDDLMGTWTEHPASPIIGGNRRSARPAGRLIVDNGNIIRYAQDCHPRYGSAVNAFEISILTTTIYREHAIGNRPVLAGSGRGWNRNGVHHVDPHAMGNGQWVACVDGWVKSQDGGPGTPRGGWEPLLKGWLSLTSPDVSSVQSTQHGVQQSVNDMSPAKTVRPPWSVRLYQEGDDEPLNALYNEVFKKQRGIDQWRWKFQNHAHLPKKVIPVGIVRDRIVAMYPSIVSRWKIGRQICLVTQPVETAIAKDARDLRLLIALWKTFVTECNALGISFLYGNPNEVHYKIGRRFLKYRDLVQLSILQKRLNLIPGFGGLRYVQSALSRLARLRFSRTGRRQHSDRIGNCTTHVLTSFDERFDRLWSRASSSYQFLAVRDRQYLEWRYGRNPQKEYVYIAALEQDELVGYLVLRVMTGRSRRTGVIQDVLSLPGRGVEDVLLEAAILRCLDERLDHIRCGALRHTELYGAAKRAGFAVRRRGKNIVYMPFDAADPEMFHDPAQWYLTLGDFDFDE